MGEAALRAVEKPPSSRDPFSAYASAVIRAVYRGKGFWGVIGGIIASYG